MEQCSAPNREDVLSPATAHTNLADVTLSETSRAQKDELCELLLTGGVRRGPIQRDGKQNDGCPGGQGAGRGQLVSRVGRVSVWGGERSSGDRSQGQLHDSTRTPNTTDLHPQNRSRQ